jgi:ABC-type transport system involved in cytochrome bd biosynthesis fused ATPase/permease subunit
MHNNQYHKTVQETVSQQLLFISQPHNQYKRQFHERDRTCTAAGTQPIQRSCATTDKPASTKSSTRDNIALGTKNQHQKTVQETLPRQVLQSVSQTVQETVICTETKVKPCFSQFESSPYY